MTVGSSLSVSIFIYKMSVILSIALGCHGTKDKMSSFLPLLAPLLLCSSAQSVLVPGTLLLMPPSEERRLVCAAFLPHVVCVVLGQLQVLKDQKEMNLVDLDT